MNITTVNAYQCSCSRAYLTKQHAIDCGTCTNCGAEKGRFNGVHTNTPLCTTCRNNRCNEESEARGLKAETKSLALPFVNVEGENWCVDDSFYSDLDDYMYDAEIDTEIDTDFTKVIAHNTKKEKLSAPYTIVQAAETVDEYWSEDADDWTPDPVGGEKFDAALKALIEAIDEQGPVVFYPIATERIDMVAYAADYHRRNPKAHSATATNCAGPNPEGTK